MQINRFEEVKGIYIENIVGQDIYGYGKSDLMEFYEVKEKVRKGNYKGNELIFFDYKNKKLYKPFEIKKNISYGNPIYSNGYFYFLRGDFDKNKMYIIKYYPEKEAENIFEISMFKVYLYNISLIGENVNMISEDDSLQCYYPKEFTCPLKFNESVVNIDDDKIYCSAWIEEGLIDGNMTDDYKYYEKLIVKDLDGNVISEEVGDISQTQDGSWWLS